MTLPNEGRLEALRIVRAALDLPTDQRREFIHREAREHLDVRDRALAMLDEIADNTQAEATQPSAPVLSPGTLIADRYRLESRLGAGGMGEVWSGMRTDGQFQQRVAIKIMHGTSALLGERFRQERQILAQLSHPNIAYLIDGGLTELGQPWFAMEHIEGQRITQWCDERKLSVEARIRLFLPICAAVQFAHRNLIIHRDIKPANILVSEDGTPKLLDFGIAKLMDQDVDQTQTLVMTPGYASPEQRHGHLVTTISDVYQLGLVLFELLCGRALHDVKRQAGETTHYPRRPDAAFTALLSQDTERARIIAQARDVTPDRLRGVLKSDLARIIDMSLADDPAERYGSAQDLMDDLQRWLRDEPVRAHRGTLSYRTSKFVRRNRLAVAVAAALSLAVVVAGVFAWQRLEAERRQQVRTQNALQFLRDLFQANNPQTREGGTLTVEQLLDGAAGRIDQRFSQDALSHGILLGELGDVYGGLGLYEDAEEQLERSIRILAPLRDVEPDRYLSSVVSLAQARIESYRYEEAITLLDEHRDFLSRSHGLDSAKHAEFLNLHANANDGLGNLTEAENDLRKAIAILENRPETRPIELVEVHNDLAHILNSAGQTRAALQLWEHVRDLLDASPDATPMQRMTNLSSTALAHLVLRESRKATELFEAVMPQMESQLGEAHNRTAIVRSQLAQAYASDGNFSGALSLIDKNLSLLNSLPDSNEMDRMMVGNVIKPRLLLQSLRLSEALPLAREGVRYLQEKMTTPTAPRSGAQWMLGEILLRSGEFDEAENMLDAALSDARALIDGTPNELAAISEDSLGRLELLRGNAADAQAHLQRAIELLPNPDNPNDRRRIRTMIHLLWATTLVDGKVQSLDEIRQWRNRLASELGSGDTPPVWQADLLIDQLAENLGAARVPAERIREAQNGLMAEARSTQPMTFTGISAL